MADSTSLVVYDPRTADPEVVGLAGFLAGYTGRTREAYALDLRQFFAWCAQRHLRLFDAHRTSPPVEADEWPVARVEGRQRPVRAGVAGDIATSRSRKRR